MPIVDSEVNIAPDGDAWELVTPLSWELLHPGSGLIITVPEGYRTDLASIPGFARWLFNPEDPRFALASIIHDFITDKPENSEAQASAVFYDALRHTGVGRVRALLMAAATYIYASWLGHTQ